MLLQSTKKSKALLSCQFPSTAHIDNKQSGKEVHPFSNMKNHISNFNIKKRKKSTNHEIRVEKNGFPDHHPGPLAPVMLAST